MRRNCTLMTINEQRGYDFTVIGVGARTLVPIPAFLPGGPKKCLRCQRTQRLSLSLSSLPPFILRLLISSSLSFPPPLEFEFSSPCRPIWHSLTSHSPFCRLISTVGCLCLKFQHGIARMCILCVSGEAYTESCGVSLSSGSLSFPLRIVMRAAV